MLQCSPQYNFYEEVFPDKVYELMKTEMKSKNHLEHQEYLWTFDQIIQFQSFFDNSKNYDLAAENVKKMENLLRAGVFVVNIAEDDFEY